MDRIAVLLRVRPGEGALVALVTGMMFAASAGGAVGSPGIEALFYSRFGVEFLPLMYIILGIVSPITSIIMTGVMARVQVSRLYGWLPLVMAVLLVGARIFLVLNLNWFYAVLWLGMNIFWIIQNLFTWGSAGLVCDGRQAKRLFPLFGVGGIVGLALGSLATGPLVNLIGTENLLLIWSLGLVIAFVVAQRLMAVSQVGVGSDYGAKTPSALDNIRQGYRTVRSSELLSWMALAAVLFAILYYSLVFPFAQAVTVEFPDEASVAAFLGTFQGIATGVAVAASLFFANRLYSRFGFMTTILVYPVIYLVGFSVVAASASFTALILFRWLQIFWSEGVAEGANQAMYNVVAPEKRERARTFIRGVANQFGVFLAGILLLLGDRIMPSDSLFFVGVAAAAFTTYFVWKARGAYGSAIVAALRAGQSHIFFSEEQPFGGFKQDGEAVTAAVAGIHSPEIAVRRVAADILGNLSVPQATQALVDGLNDEDPSVRAALLRALGSSGTSAALLEVAVLLKDPDPTVRQEAIAAITRLTEYSRGIIVYLEPLLDDPDTAVRCKAAAALLNIGPHAEAQSMLVQLATVDYGVENGRGSDLSDRIMALEALSKNAGPEAYVIASNGLRDPSPAVRRASAALIARLDTEKCIYPLVEALGDEDQFVRNAAAESLGTIGEPALIPVVEALRDPNLENGALLALSYLPARKLSSDLKVYAKGQGDMARHYHQLWQESRGFNLVSIEASSNSKPIKKSPIVEPGRLMADSLQQKARQHGANALRAMGVAIGRESISLAVDNLDSKDGQQRANAIETLESVGDSKVVRQVLPLWEGADQLAANFDLKWLLSVLRDEDPWLRAGGVLLGQAVMAQNGAAVESNMMGTALDEVKLQLNDLAESDPDPLVRETGLIYSGGASMDTLQTLSTMERILFLRQVPLFENLPPNDLKQIAAVTGERAFSDGTIIAEQGEAGDVLYIIVSGEIIVTAAAEDGSRTELGRRQSGQYVGEMAIISDEVRMARLSAHGDVRTLYISQREFKEILHQRPEVSLSVMSELCARLRELS